MVRSFVFLGVPGVGKGTMAKAVARDKGMIHISTGGIFRRHIQHKTPLGLQVKKLLAAGTYVPDDMVNAIVQAKLQEPEVLKHGFILDGYPRTIPQAKFLQALVTRTTLQVVLLEAPEEVIFQRLAKRAQEGDRPDDYHGVVHQRIMIYHEKTAPLVNYYVATGQLMRLNMDGTICENVTNFYKRCNLDHN